MLKNIRDRNPKEKLVKIPVPKFVFIVLDVSSKITLLRFYSYGTLVLLMATIRNTIEMTFIARPRRDFFSF